MGNVCMYIRMYICEGKKKKYKNEQTKKMQ